MTAYASPGDGKRRKAIRSVLVKVDEDGHVTLVELDRPVAITLEGEVLTEKGPKP